MASEEYELLDRIGEIRERVMQKEDSDVRQELADLCSAVGAALGLITNARRAARKAANDASCLANGMIPE